MVKIQDQTAAFSTIVPSRRRSRAAAAGERFRLGLHGLDCSPSPEVASRSAVIGASSWALKAEQVERTVELIGIAGGLLADLGFHVCPIGADGRPERPSLVVWVCGDETRADEYELLAAMGIPGLSIGSCVEDLEDWSFITTEEAQDRREFIRMFADEVEFLVGSARSNIWSNELRQTRSDDAGPRAAETASDLHQHGRRRTHPHPRDPGSSAS
jgi:hypothetical protein